MLPLLISSPDSTGTNTVINPDTSLSTREASSTAVHIGAAIVRLKQATPTVLRARESFPGLMPEKKPSHREHSRRIPIHTARLPSGVFDCSDITDIVSEKNREKLKFVRSL